MSERIAWIGGNQKRHLYYINQIAKEFNVVGGVMQVREDAIPLPPQLRFTEDTDNWNRHFYDRADAEMRHFGIQQPPDVEGMRVDADTLNRPEVAEYVKSLNPDICLIFGTGMIREPLLSALPEETINLHLGLSPRYRGAATLFWPFYFHEPNWAGTTFHYISHSPDAGDIIHQVTPRLEMDDGIHDVACKAVVASTVDAIALLKIHESVGRWKRYAQKPEAGKNFLQSDFRPQHLRVIYHEYDNNMVSAYLTGELTPKEPKLRRQF